MDLAKNLKATRDQRSYNHRLAGKLSTSKAHKGGIHTQVERKTRYLQAQLIKRVNADDTLQAQQHIFQSLPTSAKQSTTVDNGLEFTKHAQFEIPVFFCDPYASWQKATNENTNGLINRISALKSGEFAPTS